MKKKPTQLMRARAQERRINAERLGRHAARALLLSGHSEGSAIREAIAIADVLYYPESDEWSLFVSEASATVVFMVDEHIEPECPPDCPDCGQPMILRISMSDSGQILSVDPVTRETMLADTEPSQAPTPNDDWSVN